MNYYSNQITLQIKDVKLHIGVCEVLKNANLTVHQKERIGIIGTNGTGKSTVLKAIMGEIELDSGKIEIPSEYKIGYLPQDIELNEEKSIYENIKNGAEYIFNWIEKLESLDSQSKLRISIQDKIDRHKGWEIEDKINVLINKLSISSKDKTVKNLSGGEKRRVALAKALISEPELLILDEPTNHLDTDSITWLEEFLKEYEGTCLLVTHDRYFLDRVATRIIELDRGEFYSHNGNYSDFLENKAKRIENETIKEAKKEKFLKKEYQWVRSGVKARGTKDKGRLERYYNTLEEDKFTQLPEANIIIPPPSGFSKRIVDFKNVSYQIPSKKLLENFNFSFQKNSHIGIVGPNGAGKTTFLKLLMNLIEPDSGKVIIGERTRFNYFDQAKLILNEENTVFEEIGNKTDKIEFGDKSISLRGYLKRFLFSDDKIKSQVAHLSGGEKSRLLLAKILKNGGNFIVLDEPTNDLDLDTLRILEETLVSFNGSVLIVSHDRYFLNRVCNQIFYMKGDGSVKVFEGNYDDFIRQKGEVRNQELDDRSQGLAGESENMEDREKGLEDRNMKKGGNEGQNQIINEILTTEEKHELRKIEKKISNAEGKVKRIEAEFADPEVYSNQNKIDQLTDDLAKAKGKVSELYERWEELESRSDN